MGTVSFDPDSLGVGTFADWARWKKNQLVSGLRSHQLGVLGTNLSLVNYGDGEAAAQEGEIADAVFLVLHGRLVSLRHDATEIGSFEADDYVGLDEVLAGRTRHSTIRAVGATSAVILPRAALLRLQANEPAIYTALLNRHQEMLSERLVDIADRLAAGDHARIEEMKARERLGTAFVFGIVGLFVYTALRLAVPIEPGTSSTPWTAAVLGLFGASCAIFVRSQPFPLSTYGITTEGLGRSCALAVATSLVFLAGLAGIKAVGVQFDGWVGSGHAVLEPHGGALGMTLLYAAFVPIQEFLGRGTMQGLLSRLMVGPRGPWTALLLANCLFSLTHLHVGLVFAMLVFIPGLLWGWLFMRTNSLPAVVLSHLLIGVVSIHVLLPPF